MRPTGGAGIRGESATDDDPVIGLHRDVEIDPVEAAACGEGGVGATIQVHPADHWWLVQVQLAHDHHLAGALFGYAQQRG